MRRFIHKLRQKPKSTRQKIAFGTSASVTGVIFAVWLTVMIAGGGVGTTTGDTESQSQAASPLAAFEDNANSAFTEFRDRLTASSSNATTTTTATSSAERDDMQSEQEGTQTVERQPYWETNDKQREQEAQEDKDSDVDDRNNFWNEDN
jgi:hypothetical protein